MNVYIIEAEIPHPYDPDEHWFVDVAESFEAAERCIREDDSNDAFGFHNKIRNEYHENNTQPVEYEWGWEWIWYADNEKTIFSIYEYEVKR